MEKRSYLIIRFRGERMIVEPNCLSDINKVLIVNLWHSMKNAMMDEFQLITENPDDQLKINDLVQKHLAIVIR